MDSELRDIMYMRREACEELSREIDFFENITKDRELEQYELLRSGIITQEEYDDEREEENIYRDSLYKKYYEFVE